MHLPLQHVVFVGIAAWHEAKLPFPSVSLCKRQVLGGWAHSLAGRCVCTETDLFIGSEIPVYLQISMLKMGVLEEPCEVPSGDQHYGLQVKLLAASLAIHMGTLICILAPL